MSQFLVDSHCHLNYNGLCERIEHVVKSAEDVGVRILQTISTKMCDVPALQEIASQYSNVYYSIGVHPLHVHEEEIIDTETLISLINRDQKISGIGETGLDYYRVDESSAMELQQLSFKNHIAASQVTHLPLIVHTRDAEDDTYQILSDAMNKSPFTGVLHCFTGSLDLAMKAVELGLYISASGIITFKNADTIREVLKCIPLDRILIETDSPFLAPVPYRGKTNEPAYVTEVARTLAELRNTSYEEIARQTTENFLTLFRRVL